MIEQILGPDAIVLILCAAATEPNDCAKRFDRHRDLYRQISSEGRRQAGALYRWLSKQWGDHGAHKRLVLAFSSEALRATETMHLAIGSMHHFIFTGGDSRLYLPEDDMHRSDLLNLRKALRQAGLNPHSYADFLEYGAKLMEKYRKGVRECVSQYDTLAQTTDRILIITHPIAANAAAHALFPQHLEAVRDVQCGPCEGFLLTKDSCMQFKLADAPQSTAA